MIYNVFASLLELMLLNSNILKLSFNYTWQSGLGLGDQLLIRHRTHFFPVPACAINSSTLVVYDAHFLNTLPKCFW